MDWWTPYFPDDWPSSVDWEPHPITATSGAYTAFLTYRCWLANRTKLLRQKSVCTCLHTQVRSKRLSNWNLARWRSPICQGCSKNGRYKGGKLGKYRGNMTNRPPLWLSFVCNWIGATLFNDKFQSTCCFSRAPKEPAARNVAKPQRKGFRPKSLRCLSFAPCPHAHHFRI